MSLNTDIRKASIGGDFLRKASSIAMELLADRFDDLPRPVLAAIGAGDFAVEQLSILRASLVQQFPDGAADADGIAEFRSLTVDLPGFAQQTAADVSGIAQQVAADLANKAQQVATGISATAQHVGRPDVATERAQRIAADFVTTVQEFVGQLPGRAQALVVELPDRVNGVTGDLSVDTLRDTVEAYFELAGAIYGSLADRGEMTWARVRLSAPQPGTVVDALADPPPRTANTGVRPGRPVSAKVRTAAPRTAQAAKIAAPNTAAPNTAASNTAASNTAASNTAASKSAASKSAAARTAAPKPAAKKTAAARTAAARTAAARAAASKPAATKSAATKSAAAKPAVPKAAAPKTAAPKTAAPKTAAPKTAGRKTASRSKSPRATTAKAPTSRSRAAKATGVEHTPRSRSAATNPKTDPTGTTNPG